MLWFTSVKVVNRKKAWKGVHLRAILREKLSREEFIKEQSLELIEFQSFMRIYT